MYYFCIFYNKYLYIYIDIYLYMVLKRNKVPKRSKRIRGGLPFLNELNLLINDGVETFNETVQKINNENKIRYDEWVKFIIILRDYIIKKKCEDEESCTIEVNMPDDEIAASIANLKDHFEVRNFGHEKRIVPRQIDRGLLKKSISVLRDDDLIKSFDETFLSILNKVHGYVVTGDRGYNTKKFKSMMNIVSKLPNIKKSLTALVKPEIKTFKQRYSTILKLLEEECTGWIGGPLCSTAASLIGDDVSDLYEKLIIKIDFTEDKLTDDILIGFIRGVLPIMIPKLYGIEEFNDDVLKLKEIVPKVGLKLIEPPPSTGGKKSSRATHKEILGKQMRIYTKPNDKKEYVKHKGFLISIKEYKEHMKHAATTKKVILGKERCIYKVEGSKQDHIKYKGSLITVSDYKNLMKK
jgi:hypothetical protein